MERSSHLEQDVDETHVKLVASQAEFDKLLNTHQSTDEKWKQELAALNRQLACNMFSVKISNFYHPIVSCFCFLK